jgi:hypothetical protein
MGRPTGGKRSARTLRPEESRGALEREVRRGGPGGGYRRSFPTSALNRNGIKPPPSYVAGRTHG